MCLKLTLACCLLIVGHSRSVAAEDYAECEGVAAEVYVNSNNRDCTGYIFCNGENSFQDDCPAGSLFDVEQQLCNLDTAFICNAGDSAESIEETDNAAATTAQTTQATTTTTTTAIAKPHEESASVKHPKCTAEMNRKFPHAQRCEYYYQCYRGFLAISRCSFGHAWDDQKQKCLQKEVAHCHTGSYLRVYK